MIGNHRIRPGRPGGGDLCPAGKAEYAGAGEGDDEWRSGVEYV